MKARTVHVNLADRSYDIRVATDEWTELGPFARQRNHAKLALVVTDENVAPHAQRVENSLSKADYQTSLIKLPSGEAQKSLPTAQVLYDNLIDLRADRQTLIVPVGGGVIGDLAGFVASTYGRGVPLLMVPTTLLAMVDSSVGGKVAVNHPKAKNMIGAFHQPLGVWIDTALLGTLPDREFRSGLAEVVKYGVIMDADFFSYLEEHSDAILNRQVDAIRHIVAHCCRLKADIVEQDEREETGLRVILNYGHTFAHAFETAAGYSAWLHGEAVAAGMMCAAKLAHRRGLIDADLVDRQERLLAAFGLPLAPEPWLVDDLITTMRSDKKAVAGKLRFILPERLGKVSLFADVVETDVVEVLTS